MLAGGAGADCGPTIRIDAEVDADLATVRGVMWLDPSLRDVVLTDPLARLPEPDDDLRLLRTYPGRPNQGQIRWAINGDRVTFEAHLPHRYGAVGGTRFGLFANGAWYPQPTVAGAVPLLDWTVTVTLPDGTGGMLDRAWGRDRLAWSGCGERAGLAVVRPGTFTQLAGGDVVLMTRRAPRRGLVKELDHALQRLPERVVGSVVEAPMRRRLVRQAPGLGYISDRAFRLTPPARFAHRRAVVRGLLAAWVQDPDPQQREIAAAALGQAYDATLSGEGADRLLGAFRWVPQVNALLASRRTPFYAEILDRVHPGDPVRDDLVEIYAPSTPGAAVVAQLDDRYGPGTGRCVGDALLEGVGLGGAALRCGVDADWLVGWKAPYPDQDYTLEVRGPRLVIDREAPEDAQPEAVVVTVDGVPRTLLLAPGPHAVALAKIPRRVVLDPQRHTAQRSRIRDAWPARYDVTLAALLSSINLSQGQLFGSGFLTIRRQYDTRNLLIGSLSNSRADLVSVDVAFLRKVGPLLDGWTRRHRLQVRGGVSLFNPSFAASTSPVALDGSLSWAHDTRVNGDFPMRGHRVGLAVGGGVLPGTNDAWMSVSGSAAGVVSPHPRHAVAGRASVAVARSPLPQRRLTLGGESLMRSIPTLPACTPADDVSPCTRLATERAVAAVEYRVAALRGLSLPLWLVWGSELQLTGGLEAVLARVDGAPVWATGATLGLFALGDVLGAESMGIGVTAAWPLAYDPALEELERDGVPEIYLRFSQAF